MQSNAARSNRSQELNQNVATHKPTCHHEAVLPLGLSWQQRAAALERLMRPQELEPCCDRKCTAHTGFQVLKRRRS
jgi:hypothetical protein